jgi:Acetyltransferase (GNAT) domain
MTRSAPDLYTAELALVFARPSAFWELWDLCSDSEICRWMLSGQQRTMELAIASYEARMADAAQGMGIWLIKQGDTQRPIGCVSLAPSSSPGFDSPRRFAALDLHIALLPIGDAKSVAQEVARAVIRYAFCRQEVQSIRVSCAAKLGSVVDLFGRSGRLQGHAGACASEEQSGQVISRQRFLSAALQLTAPMELG